MVGHFAYANGDMSLDLEAYKGCGLVSSKVNTGDPFGRNVSSRLLPIFVRLPLLFCCFGTLNHYNLYLINLWNEWDFSILQVFDFDLVMYVVEILSASPSACGYRGTCFLGDRMTLS